MISVFILTALCLLTVEGNDGQCGVNKCLEELSGEECFGLPLAQSKGKHYFLESKFVGFAPMSHWYRESDDIKAPIDSQFVKIDGWFFLINSGSPRSCLTKPAINVLFGKNTNISSFIPLYPKMTVHGFSYSLGYLSNMWIKFGDNDAFGFGMVFNCGERAPEAPGGRAMAGIVGADSLAAMGAAIKTNYSSQGSLWVFKPRKLHFLTLEPEPYISTNAKKHLFYRPLPYEETFDIWSIARRADFADKNQNEPRRHYLSIDNDFWRLDQNYLRVFKERDPLLSNSAQRSIARWLLRRPVEVSNKDASVMKIDMEEHVAPHAMKAEYIHLIHHVFPVELIEKETQVDVSGIYEVIQLNYGNELANDSSVFEDDKPHHSKTVYGNDLGDDSDK